MTPTDFDILLVTLFTWSLKVKFSSSVTPRNLTVETFVRIVSRILVSNAFFGRLSYMSFTNVQVEADGGGCATMRERPESVESPGTYVTK